MHKQKQKLTQNCLITTNIGIFTQGKKKKVSQATQIDIQLRFCQVPALLQPKSSL